MCGLTDGVMDLLISVAADPTYSPTIVRSACSNRLFLDNVGFVHLATEGNLHHTFQHPISSLDLEIMTNENRPEFDRLFVYRKSLHFPSSGTDCSTKKRYHNK